MKILFVSLGCDKNLVDTEEMLAGLAEHGYTFTDDEEEAEIVIINTCCFINDAKKESIDAILEMADRKTSGQLKALIVAGCLGQRYKEEIIKEIPEVDAVIGTTAQEELIPVLDQVLGQVPERKKICLQPLDGMPAANAGRILTTGGYYGYLRIAEGCDKCCTYCVIPIVRGPFRSVSMETLVRQAEDLAGKGVRELILVAQETTLYGVDLYGEKKLPELLRRLAGIEGIEWIRILYAYPEEITPELVKVIKEEPKVLHYLDMPIQHASDPVLKRMGRRTNRKELEEIVAFIRQEIPDMCLRTTLITGFPGELEKDHQELVAFVKKMQFDRLGVFTYSKEEGTPAARLRPQVPAPVKRKRQKELMLAQQQIAFRQARKMKGRVLTAMVEGKLVGEDVYTARTYKDAPGVDGLLFIETRKELMTGDFIRVKVTGSQEYDLIGKPV